MGMTMSQKILAAHAGLSEVKAGQLIEADLDLVLGNDITSPVAINEMKKMDKKTVFDKDKIALVMIILSPTRTSSRRRTASAAGSLPAPTRLPITLMWGRWELSTLSFRRRAWWWLGTR